MAVEDCCTKVTYIYPGVAGGTASPCSPAHGQGVREGAGKKMRQVKQHQKNDKCGKISVLTRLPILSPEEVRKKKGKMCILSFIYFIYYIFPFLPVIIYILFPFFL